MVNHLCFLILWHHEAVNLVHEPLMCPVWNVPLYVRNCACLGLRLDLDHA